MTLSQISCLPKIVRGSGHLSFAHTDTLEISCGISSPMLTPSGPGHTMTPPRQPPSSDCDVQVKYRACSPTLMTTKPSLQPAVGGKRQGGMRASLPQPCYPMGNEWQGQLAHPYQGRLTFASYTRISFIALSRRCRTCSLECCSSWGAWTILLLSRPRTISSASSKWQGVRGREDISP